MKIDVEERAVRARSLFESGMNCAQSVAVTYADCCRTEPELLERMTLALGGGVGRQREICGTVTGASVVLGMVGNGDKSACYHKVQSFSAAFRAAHGSIVCRELLGLPRGVDDNAQPSPRTEAYYARRPCAEYVEQSARILGKMLETE